MREGGCGCWGGAVGTSTPGGSERSRASHTRIRRTPDLGSTCCEDDVEGTGEDDEGDEDVCSLCSKVYRSIRVDDCLKD